MSNNNGTSSPAITGDMILQTQNRTEALRLLVAQRRLYSKSKVWFSAKWIGMIISGIVGPVLVSIVPQASVAVGSIAGVWIFLGRTVLHYFQKKNAEQAAAIQERFDLLVFGMPKTSRRVNMPPEEEISLLTGTDEEVLNTANEEQLLNWYHIPKSTPREIAVAISQRSNTVYSYQLLKSTISFWVLSAIFWGILVAAICVFTGMALSTFLLGVVLPLLPALLDVTEHIFALSRSTKDRHALYSEIDSKINANEVEITRENLQDWQKSLFELRRDAPVVPNFIYKIKRKKNEQAMAHAAEKLGSHSKTSG